MQNRYVRVAAAAAVGLLALTVLTGCSKSKKDGQGFGGGGFIGGAGNGESSSLPSGFPTNLPSGFPSLPTGLPSYTPGYGYTPAPDYSYSYSAPPTYNPDAISETSGTNCRYDQSTNQFKYDVTVTNTDSTRSFRYMVSVKWKESGSSMIGYDSQTVTVLPGSTQHFTATSYYSVTRRISYTCQVDSATKYVATS
ncbi:hypothetical protein RKE29_29475 [Streptomyces sp. B1866]|uniref:hypothetical protein n=1 Tax=Streptomyces sp. B1866 TaxID=3075431 RepID=UPI00288ECCB1|nr:hypothetical protein [Streptomyces sp. B1866]MDT3400684.1 hypothetical protein [Streptomyces sp. B1866]